MAVIVTGLGVRALVSACSTDDSTPGPDLPDASGAAVWSFLQDVKFQEAWDLWPGKGELFEGGEPHGALHTVYISPIGSDALNEKIGFMPDGALIIKENYSAEAVLDNLTVMYKVPGYDDANNDWFWAMIGVDGQVRVEGKVEGCQQCHGARRDNDFVMVGELE